MAELKISVSRINMIANPRNSLKAFVDMDFSGIIVKGFKIMDGQNGLWLAVPSMERKKEAGKYDDTVFIKDKAMREDVQEVALMAYRAKESGPGDDYQ